MTDTVPPAARDGTADRSFYRGGSTGDPGPATWSLIDVELHDGRVRTCDRPLSGRTVTVSLNTLRPPRLNLARPIPSHCRPATRRRGRRPSRIPGSDPPAPSTPAEVRRRRRPPAPRVP